MPETEIRFAVLGGPHGGLAENPTCYARTTQKAKFNRRTRPRISARTGKLLPTHLTPWARYQDYIEHVRRSITWMERDVLHGKIWGDLRGGLVTYRCDVVAQFVGRRHSDADHVASAIADALFPGPLRSKPPRPGSRDTSWQYVWSRRALEAAPGDANVVARILDCRDMEDYAFVGIHVHGPYPRDAWNDPELTRTVLGLSIDDFVGANDAPSLLEAIARLKE